MATPTIKYVPVDQFAGAPAFSASGTFASSLNVFPPVAFGQEVKFKDVQTASTNAGGAVAVFCQGSNVASAGQFVQIVNNSAILLNTANSKSGFPVGIAGAPMTATNVYGWVGVEGKFDNGAFTNVSAAAGAAMFFGVTAGQVNTTGSASNDYLELRGINLPVSFTSADGSATDVGYRALTVQLARPFPLMRGVTNTLW